MYSVVMSVALTSASSHLRWQKQHTQGNKVFAQYVTSTLRFQKWRQTTLLHGVKKDQQMPTTVKCYVENVTEEKELNKTKDLWGLVITFSYPNEYGYLLARGDRLW